MTGQLIYLVGSSGCGKDSILRELKLSLSASHIIMKRAITRPSSIETEDFESLSVAAFLEQKEQGEFALSWRANGLVYGVRTELDEQLALGKTVLMNGSRAHWPYVLSRYPSAVLVLVRVDNRLLRQRLIKRGRESEQEIQLRLERNDALEQTLTNTAISQKHEFWVIDNSGDLSLAVEALKQRLTQLSKG